MFGLLAGLWEYCFRKDELHVLILGVDKAGKTTLLEKMKSMYTDHMGLDPERILPTVGLNVGRIEAHKTKLIFWDLGGQSGLRSIWDKYFEEAHAIVFLVDGTAPERFEESKLALERVLGSRDIHGAPLLVLANKQDASGCRGPDEVQEFFGVGRVDTRPVRVSGISAHTGEGIRESIFWLVDAICRSPRTLRLRHKSAA
uniref:ADP-ribosylation factor related protein 1 n=1 Tax=Tetraselmis sp. GSL018 TaxID=582737 RepID=A0A061RW84_9CHLO|mmetsp:Transcript_980/g.2334  ORF Transcript_980/g.2334 Transcript_980/m.2334 type:complete len:200 (+) Transcript_980:287-886(+)